MNTTTENMRIIARDIICINPQNPRADQGDLSELAASIKAHGIIQPIAVRRVEDGYMVVAGSRRLAAAKLAGLDRIPCVVVDVDDDQAHELATAENVIRQDMSLIDEIRAVERLTLTGESHAEIAARFGRTARWVATRRKIANMPSIVLDKIAEGTLSIADAEMLCKIGDGNAIAEIVEESDDIAESVNRRLRELSDAPWVNGKSECAKCLQRSDKQVNLFDDGGPARCMDEKCWEQKRNTWKAKKEAELRAAGHLPKESWQAAYNIEHCYGGYLLEGRDDEEIAELKEAGVKPRYHITEENEVLLRYYHPDLPKKTVKIASGDDEVEEDTHNEVPESNDTETESAGTEDDDEEEPYQPVESSWVRRVRLRDEAVRRLLDNPPNAIDADLLLDYAAEALRRNIGDNPMDAQVEKDNVASVVGMARDNLRVLLLASLVREFFAAEGEEAAFWQDFAEAFGIKEVKACPC